MVTMQAARGGHPLAWVGAIIALVGALLLPGTLARAASGSELFFSEYVEGTGTNRAVEIYNPTDVPVSLGASGYMLAFFFDGSTTIGGGVPLAGTLQPGATWVVAPTNAGAALLAKANQKFGTAWFDGNDAVALIHAGVAVDVVGQIGFDPGVAWGTGGNTTADHTLRRKASVTAGDPNGLDAFDPAVEWDAYPVDTFDGLGSIGSANQAVAITCPGPMSTLQGVATTAGVTATDPDGRVTAFSAAVGPGDPGTVTVGDVTPAAAAGGTASATLDVAATTPAGTFTVTLTAANDDATPQTASCTVDVEVSPVTVDALRALVEAMVGDGRVAADKAKLLERRLDRVADAMADGRGADAAAQLRAFANQVQGLAPRWISPESADLLVAEAALLAGG